MSDTHIIAIGETEDGQLTVGLEDFCGHLKKLARHWFSDDAEFHTKFDHVIAAGQLDVRRADDED